MSHLCKRIFRFELELSSYWQNIQVSPNCPKFLSHKSKFFKYICNFLDQLLHPYIFHVRDMSGILFFIFASCEPLTTYPPIYRSKRSSTLPIMHKDIFCKWFVMTLGMFCAQFIFKRGSKEHYVQLLQGSISFFVFVFLCFLFFFIYIYNFYFLELILLIKHNNILIDSGTSQLEIYTCPYLKGILPDFI